MGKRQIGEMQPFEFIVTLIIADLACIPMADVSIPLIYGIVAILGLFVFHQLFSLLEQSGKFFKLVISGKPSLVLNKQGVDLKELHKNNMNVEDLIESMRAKGYFSLDDVEYAIFESNGKLSTMEKTNRQSTPSSLPVLIISEGKISKENTKVINKTASQIITYLNARNVSLKNVEVMTVDGNGRAYIQVKKTPYFIDYFPLMEGAKW
jgi:uncharacterized membrane protein YcaP (DUF421 family)